MNTKPEKKPRLDDPSLSPQEVARRVGYGSMLSSSLFQRKKKAEPQTTDVLCIGGANLDYKLQLNEPFQSETSNPISSSLSHGGVIRNVAENLANLGQDVSLMTLLGDDPEAQAIKSALHGLVDTSPTEELPGIGTGKYYAILSPSGSLEAGLVDMAIAKEMTTDWIARHHEDLERAGWIVADCNLPPDALEYLIERTRSMDKKLAIVTISGPKMKHLPADLTGVSLLITNQLESEAFFHTKGSPTELASQWRNRGVQRIIITDGKEPVTYADEEVLLQVPVTPVPEEQALDVTGAGDAFSAASLAGILMNLPPQRAIQLGNRLAARTIQSNRSVLEKHDVEELMKEMEL